MKVFSSIVALLFTSAAGEYLYVISLHSIVVFLTGSKLTTSHLSTHVTPTATNVQQLPLSNHHALKALTTVGKAEEGEDVSPQFVDVIQHMT